MRPDFVSDSAFAFFAAGFFAAGFFFAVFSAGALSTAAGIFSATGSAVFSFSTISSLCSFSAAACFAWSAFKALFLPGFLAFFPIWQNLHSFVEWFNYKLCVFKNQLFNKIHVSAQKKGTNSWLYPSNAGNGG
ncbi:MAG: hypothetical protein E7425_11265 [Ruminococcaceae bacterium]|nr:hypothetical protein [Oscillospiraceae bacterium]